MFPEDKILQTCKFSPCVSPQRQEKGICIRFIFAFLRHIDKVKKIYHPLDFGVAQDTYLCANVLRTQRATDIE